MTEEAEPLWDVEQVADYLQVPKSTLYGWIDRGTGPPSYKVGRYRRYRISEVDAWLSDKLRAERADFGNWR